MNITTYMQDLMKKLSGSASNSSGTSAAKNENELLEKIAQIRSSVLPEKTTLGSGKTYQRLEYDAPSDEEISESAEKSLESYRKSGLSSIENEIESEKDKYGADKVALTGARDKTLSAVEDAYTAAKDALDSDVIKRGLARSSIAVAQSGALAGKRAAKSAQAHSDYESAIADIDSKLSELSVKRQKAIDDFNVAYTAKLTETINELSDKRTKLATEAMKYNNTLAEKENEEEIARAKAEESIYSQALANAQKEGAITDDPGSVANQRVYGEIYKVMREYLASMAPSAAYEEMKNNPLYRSSLSDAYYYKLYDEFAR